MKKIDRIEELERSTKTLEDRVRDLEVNLSNHTHVQSPSSLYTGKPFFVSIDEYNV